ncbi:MAG: hypothetical protein ACK559_17885, partial [bacterium]
VEKQPGRQELTQETFQTGRGMAPPSVLISPLPSGGDIDAANSVFIPLAAMMRKVRNTFCRWLSFKSKKTCFRRKHSFSRK